MVSSRRALARHTFAALAGLLAIRVSAVDTPTLHSGFPVSANWDWKKSGTTVESPSFTPPANTMLYAVVLGSSVATDVLSVTGGGLTWTRAIQLAPNGVAAIYTAVTGSSPGRMTVTATLNASNSRSIVVYAFDGAQALTGATASSRSAAPAVSLTPLVSNSLILCAANAGTSDAFTMLSGSVADYNQVLISDAHMACRSSSGVASGQPYTIGSSGPAVSGNIVAIEVLPVGGVVNPPATPTNLDAAPYGSTSIQLTWTASPLATSYKVQRAPDVSGSPGTWGSPVTTSASPYLDTGLSTGTRYWYRLAGNNLAGDSAYTSAESQALPPATPTNPAATAESSSSIRVSWTASTGATSYWVEHAPDAGGSPGIWYYHDVASASPYFYANLSASTRYWYRVAAANSGGQSVYTSAVSATTQALPPALSLSPTALTFSGTVGGGNPAARTVTASNSGGGTLAVPTTSVTYGSGAGWLITSVSGSSAPYTVTVTPNISGLAAGTYTATVSVASAGATGSPGSVSVSLTVSPGPTLSLSPTSLTFSGTAEGANPAAQTVTASNSGSGTLAVPTTSISYGSGSGWLSTSVSGSLAPYTITVTPSIAGLAAGTYTATVSVTSAGATGSPGSVSVSLILSTTLPTSCSGLPAGTPCGSPTACGGQVCDGVSPNCQPRE